MIKANNIGAVVLGAGSSSRLGEAKQLLKFQEKTFLQHVTDTIRPFNFSSKVVVLGANADEILNTMDTGDDTGDLKIVINAAWREGIASSIRTGIRQSLDLNPSVEDMLFLLTDQPFVSPDLIGELVMRHRQGHKRITGSKYKNTVGVPAIFDRSLFPELMRLHGDVGARYIMGKYAKDVETVAFEMGYFDIDTREDYRKLQRYKK